MTSEELKTMNEDQETKSTESSTRNFSPTSGSPLVVSYGGGTNSTAMLCGFREKGVKPSLILFADTGAEMPHTYEHVAIMQSKVREWWGMEIVTVRPKKTIVQHCEDTSMLPSLAYGRRSCSQKFKHEPMERYVKTWMRENKIERITKAIGYHANEGGRAFGKPTEKALAKGLTETYWYPLIEWMWRQEDCVAAICRNGLPQAGKSACYFCPASKRSEVVRLKEEHPELMERALRIESEAQKRHRTKRGLGGEGNLWADWLAMDEAQTKLMLDIEPMHVPCGCYDG